MTCAVVAAFLTTLLTGAWREGSGLMDHALPIAGLVIGGLPAAAIAGYLPKIVPRKSMMGAVALLVIGLSAYELLKTGGIL